MLTIINNDGSSNQIHFEISVRMTITKKTSDNKCWEIRGEKGTLVYCWWKCKLVQPLWKTVWRFFKKFKIQLPCDPATPLLSVYPKEIKSLSQKDICTSMFFATFTIAKTWKQPKCLSMDEQMKKMWGIYIMEYHLAIKKKEILPLVRTWKLEGIMPSEVNQTKKFKYYTIFVYMRHLKNKL